MTARTYSGSRPALLPVSTLEDLLQARERLWDPEAVCLPLTRVLEAGWQLLQVLCSRSSSVQNTSGERISEDRWDLAAAQALDQQPVALLQHKWPLAEQLPHAHPNHLRNRRSR